MTTATERAHACACCDDTQDADWGRRAGAVPPLRWWWPAAVLAVAVAVLGVLVTVVVRGPGPLDDPRLSDQRDGLLLEGPTLPAAVAGVPFGGEPVVVLFERTPPSGPAYDEWTRAVADAGARLVVSDGEPRREELASAVGMPTPVDGGPPVGYAVVDPTGTVRYATLDPEYTDNAYEIGVIVGAVEDAR